MVNAIWKDWQNMTVGDACLVALIAIIIVFLVLIILIVVCHYLQKGMDKVDSITHIQPKEENKILEEDKDAAIAVIVASIDFKKETGKNCEVVKITKEEE